MVVEIVFMIKSPRKNVPDMGIKLGTACMPSGHHTSDRATGPDNSCMKKAAQAILKNMLVCCLPTQNFQIGSAGRKKIFFALSKKKTLF